MRVAAHGGISLMDRRIRQTATASPAEPGIPTDVRMPLTAGPISYRFVTGALAEIARCPDHGDYLRRFTESSLQKVIEVCSQAEPINWVKMTHLAYGMPGDDIEAYKRQPGEVRIYNPKCWPLDKLLCHESGSIIYDIIEVSGMTCLIPWVYSLGDKLIHDCPKCLSLSRKGRGKKPTL